MAEVEESNVGETQLTRCKEEDEEAIGPTFNEQVGPMSESPKMDSQTKTITLEDDRRTDQVVNQVSDSLNDTGSESLSAPPRFERIGTSAKGEREIFAESERDTKREKKKERRKETRRTSLKFIDQVKEKARKKKEGHKKRRRKQQQAIEETLEEWDSKEDIKMFESDEEDTWWVGRKTGLVAKSVTPQNRSTKSRTCLVSFEALRTGTHDSQNLRSLGSLIDSRLYPTAL
ncbi:hypothetical protein PIB30_024710 [Stylosanthes scabra]|uniref:Uncharacterized protein n=1 Tax=Stylosanthes scabra TaxID=79078 RepID=A0ABU6RA23_9FABA|nr:hypothetical protein [Stylosanthes scabra]